MTKRMLAFLLALALWALPASAEMDTINPYVIKADVRAYMTDADVALYEKLVDGVFARAARVALSDDYDANLRAFSALRGNPYSFFMDKLTFTSDHTAVNLTYAYTAEEQAETRDYMDGTYLSILNSIIAPWMNELDETLAVYQYFGERIEYDYDWLGALDMSDEKFLFPEIEIYQALKTGKGVCHSYSYLCEFALQQLGIECLRLSGDVTGTDEGHMWLAVRLDGKYCHIDSTWDDRGDTEGLHFFGMTDAERTASGVENYGLSYDGAYGEIACDDDSFAAFRGVIGFSFIKGEAHRVLLDYGDHTAVFDTETMEIIGNKGTGRAPFGIAVPDGSGLLKPGPRILKARASASPGGRPHPSETWHPPRPRDGHQERPPSAKPLLRGTGDRPAHGGTAAFLRVKIPLPLPFCRSRKPIKE